MQEPAPISYALMQEPAPITNHQAKTNMNSGSAAFSPTGEMTVNALYLQKRILQILIIASQKHTNYS